MKSTQVIFIAVTAMLVVTCKSSKQSTKTSSASTPAAESQSSATSATNTSNPGSLNAGLVIMTPIPAAGVYAPGEEELIAVQPYYKDITLDKLNKGYSLYAQSACIQCHPAKSVFEIKASEWKNTLEIMSLNAKITNEQKEAINQYVLAVKAVKLNKEK